MGLIFCSLTCLCTRKDVCLVGSGRWTNMGYFTCFPICARRDVLTLSKGLLMGYWTICHNPPLKASTLSPHPVGEGEKLP